MRILVAVLAGCAVGLTGAAAGQGAKAYKGEIVMTAEGAILAPWVEKQVCSASRGTCRTMIVNSKTSEIALLGDKLSTHFERTGNGLEVQRAEASIEKAKRLQTR